MPGSDEYAPFYKDYIGRVPAGDIVVVLGEQIGETLRLLDGLTEAAADRAYAPGKWTIKDVVGHVIDSERVFSQRALRFARGDVRQLPGFEQDPYVLAGGFAARSLRDLTEELAAVRRATVLLFRGLPEEAWGRRGVASGHEVSVRALAHIIAGHELHHRAILTERYGVPGRDPGERSGV
jgi:uncharacterized damage-inducible protein DinB